MSFLKQFSEDLKDFPLSPEEVRSLQKVMKVLFLGQVVGLPTMNSILEKYELRNNQHKVCYKKICKKLSINEINRLFDKLFEQQLLSKLSELTKKDSSCWSRELVTVVLDDSIFRQWLKEQGCLDDFEAAYYNRFYSGQFCAAVYGFKVLTFGVCIDGIFYPLYFEYVAKKTERIPDSKKATEKAIELVGKWKKLVQKATEKGIIIPKLHFSCDSGYSDVSLSNACENSNLIYISVPKKSHIIQIQGKGQTKQNIKLSDWVSQIFLKKEQKHNKSQENLPQSERTPYTCRIKVFYRCQNRNVTLLAFRYQGSKKVSLIYTTKHDIKEKTLRNHWFQRTYIEQFFKTLKHVLKIQEARTTNRHDFHFKLVLFAFMAYHVQCLVKFIRKSYKLFKKRGFISIQRTLNNDKTFYDILQEILIIKT